MWSFPTKWNFSQVEAVVHPVIVTSRVDNELKYMLDYKWLIKYYVNWTWKLKNIALNCSILDTAIPSENTMKLVEEYVAGNIEFVDILKIFIEKYCSSELEF